MRKGFFSDYLRDREKRAGRGSCSDGLSSVKVSRHHRGGWASTSKTRPLQLFFEEKGVLRTLGASRPWCVRAYTPPVTHSHSGTSGLMLG